MKYLYLLLGFATFTYSQSLKVSNIVSENKLTSFSEQKLILVDFWATWCAPCVYATKQLEILQKQNKEKIFIISISDEHESKIRTYLLKKPIELMVTSDYENFTFDKYEVVSRPYAVLLNLDGKVLWKGSPADLSQQKLEQFYKSEYNSSYKKSIEEILVVNSEEFVASKNLERERDILISELTLNTEELIKSNEELIFSGALDNLFFTLNSSYPFEYKFTEMANKKVKVISSKRIWDTKKEKIMNKVLDFFDLNSTVKKEELEVTEIVLEQTNMLWDSNQLNWEGSPSNYIVGIDRIQADNMTIKSLCSLLGKVKGKNYMYSGKDDNEYDWDFHYEYDNLMEEEFENSFGIKFKLKKITIPVTYISTKK